MCAFAHPIGEPVNEHGLLELEEFSIAANAVSIRTLASFLLARAAQMDAMGDKYDPVQAQDTITGWDDQWPDLVIFGRAKIRSIKSLAQRSICDQSSGATVGRFAALAGLLH